MTLRRETLLTAEPLQGAAFAPFGEVVDCMGDPTVVINAGRCERYSDLARMTVTRGRVGLSLFSSNLCNLPYRCDLVERHPLGSQCFVPMGNSNYLLLVAEDQNGTPVRFQAFAAGPDQAVNIAQNVWHGVLAPISGSGLFAVLDRIGSGNNLEEYELPSPIVITGTREQTGHFGARAASPL